MAPHAPTACRTPRCGGYAVERGLCAECLKNAPPIQANQHDSRDQWRHLYQRSRWRNVVQPAVLRRDPICTVCHRRPSTVADHIVDHRGDEKLFWAMDNLAGKCKPCHDEKTGTEHGFKREGNLPPKQTSVPEPGGVPEGVDFKRLLNLVPQVDPTKRKG